MFDLIKNSYVSYVKNFGYIFAIMFWFVTYTLSSTYIDAGNIDFINVSIFQKLNLVISTIFLVLVEIFIYKRFLKLKIKGFMNWAKKSILILFVRVVLMCVAFLPIFLLNVFVSFNNLYLLSAVLLANAFLGFALYARLNVITPMILSNEKITFKSVVSKGKQNRSEERRVGKECRL